MIEYDYDTLHGYAEMNGKLVAELEALRAENAKLLEALNGLMADYYVARRMDGFTDLDVRGLEAYKKARAALGESDG